MFHYIYRGTWQHEFNNIEHQTYTFSYYGKNMK